MLGWVGQGWVWGKQKGVSIPVFLALATLPISRYCKRSKNNPRAVLLSPSDRESIAGNSSSSPDFKTSVFCPLVTVSLLPALPKAPGPPWDGWEGHREGCRRTEVKTGSLAVEDTKGQQPDGGWEEGF